MNKQIAVLLSSAVILILANGCKGPKGDTGPVGPAGSNAADDSTSTTNSHALRFVGTSSYVSIPFSPVLKPSPFTVELWVYVDTLYSPFIPLISATDEDQRNTADGYDIKFESGQFYLRLASAPNVAAAYGPLYTPPTKQWIHLACTVDAAHVTLYVNGQQLAQYANAQQLSYGKRGLTVGMGYHTTYGGYSFFQGMMDEIRIWNIARTQSQIQQTMTTKLTGTETGLVGYWNFDDNRFSPLVMDATKNHNNGILSNDGIIPGDAYLVTTTPF